MSRDDLTPEGFASGDFSSDDDYDGLDPAEMDEYSRAAQLVFQELSVRLGEGNPQPRLEPTRRVVELLGDVHCAYPIIHIAGTNGKTTTARLIESILRAYGLSTGVFTSPHLVSFNERILLNGVPVRDDVLVTNWLDVKPYVELVDAELESKGEPRLTFFEVMTILAYGTFADAPVDVAIVEAGLGGEWDSTNVADGAVAVFTPIALDHTDRLGKDLDAIARTKSGIIKPSSMVVSAAQNPVVRAVLEEAVDLTESTLTFVSTTDIPEVGNPVAVVSRAVAVGGQMVTIQGAAGRYEDIFLALYGDHQAENAALAIAAVEAFLGGASQALEQEVLAEACATVTSPGRLQLVASEPTVLVDAAHNPHGAQSLTRALSTYFTFDDVTIVLAIFEDKDAEGIIDALAQCATRFIVTSAPSERSRSARDLGFLVADKVGDDKVVVEPDPVVALAMARGYAANSDKGAVVVTGSITLVGLTVGLAEESQGWTL
ncbi:bifunctional folylpolyglutamate synthase/dihydrofolate synthase [Aurantimicrobium minutum]|uniref:bifunctional folylpolyglutamate synthase/dihydrofolate synthase n=1 Tax=Aurantimicrobium minutum TaxID=708131 RepID=UPI0024754D33|nr:Mur ligase family protein [Aurantimicrobium minutum]MDH6422707.1 dihydrofolate synthase/folylpolyglutamate synthase [Aurantimicrobium minutum]